NFSVIRPPVISSVVPAGATVGTSVTLIGTDLSNATDVEFNGTSITSPITILSASIIKVTVPIGATTGKISVRNLAGTASSSGIFKVIPRIDGFVPASALPGESITIMGNNFSGATAVR